MGSFSHCQVNLEAERGVLKRRLYLQVDEATGQTETFGLELWVWDLDEVVGGNCALDLDCLATDFLGLRRN